VGKAETGIQRISDLAELYDKLSAFAQLTINVEAQNQEAAKAVGKLIAERALAQCISEVVFDRGGHVYHGRIKALAEAAREAGLKF